MEAGNSILAAICGRTFIGIPRYRLEEQICRSGKDPTDIARYRFRSGRYRGARSREAFACDHSFPYRSRACSPLELRQTCADSIRKPWERPAQASSLAKPVPGADSKSGSRDSLRRLLQPPALSLQSHRPWGSSRCSALRRAVHHGLKRLQARSVLQSTEVARMPQICRPCPCQQIQISEAKPAPM